MLCFALVMRTDERTSDRREISSESPRDQKVLGEKSVWSRAILMKKIFSYDRNFRSQ